jgi:hypothetical protein
MLSTLRLSYVDDLYGVVAEGSDEQSMSVRIQREVIDPPLDARQLDRPDHHKWFPGGSRSHGQRKEKSGGKRDTHECLILHDMMERKQHWEQVFESRGATEVSWFQREPTLSLRLLETAGLHGES